MTSYNPVTPAIAEELKSIVGENHLLYRDAEALQPFSKDEIPGTRYRTMPEAVVFPENADQVSKIVRLANRELIPLTPRGAGSGLSGGAVPIYGGIVIASSRMNRILEFDADNLMITVEPGVIANDINEHIKDSGLFYAGYPMSMESCFIGGNIGENAGGGKAVKYGVTSRYVLGLEVVLPNGDIVEVGGKLLKDVTGYNMVPLFSGSEGTLGFVTRIILKLIPRPKEQVDLLCLFKEPEQAVKAVPEILTKSGVLPTSLEYMDKVAVQKACDYLHEELPYDQCGAMLIVTLDGDDMERLTAEYERVGKFCQECGAIEIYVADNKVNSERIWKIRRAVPEAFSLASPLQSGEDVVVPPSAIAKVAAECRRIAEKYGVFIPCYGHAGDGNLHARVTPPKSWSEDQWYETLPSILKELYAAVKKEGGRISGEHGIGHKRKKYMECVVSPEYLNMLRTLKKAFDPNNIMNPGKIFDLE